VADIIHKYTCRATMLWSPNTGCGYPFAYGQVYSYCSNTTLSPADIAECDVNGDGIVSLGARGRALQLGGVQQCECGTLPLKPGALMRCPPLALTLKMLARTT
jgi:hypothetical protein